MPARQPLPRLWLFTDERIGDGLMQAVARLPASAGIVVRHYSLGAVERRALFEQIRSAAPGLVILSGPLEQAAAWGADGSHGRHQGATTAPAHDLREIRAAETAGARLVFLSPVFPTRSHPGRPALGANRFDALAGRTDLPVIALGGMSAERAKALSGAYGWAGIDAWIG